MLVSATPVRDDTGQIALAVMSWYDVTARKRMEEDLRHSREALEQRIVDRTQELAMANKALGAEAAERQIGDEDRRELLRQLVTAQEEEQRRISRELHDQMGQSLTGLKFILDTLARRGGTSQAQLIEAVSIVNDLMTRVGELSLDLRPAVLDDMGVLPALGTLIERFNRQTGIAVTFEHEGLQERLDPTLETTIYRLVQEALTNVARHSGAREVTVRVVSDSAVFVEVLDPGRGFDPQQQAESRQSRGLLGMRERAALVGGTLSVESTPGSGTRITARLPKQTAAPTAQRPN
jgi:signal transduction histidine kinase